MLLPIHNCPYHCHDENDDDSDDDDNMTIYYDDDVFNSKPVPVATVIKVCSAVMILLIAILMINAVDYILRFDQTLVSEDIDQPRRSSC